ncbi:hypothetical protein R5R35_003342 [Gryllus longicercus]|uniref:Uncharacterized protein n=1 Tax=Gryllus longicercus TaxID=2509291 RepID=A0AAN9VTF3_9ORTH
MRGVSETSLHRSGSRRAASRGNERTHSSDSLASDHSPQDGFQPGTLNSVQEAEGSEESDGDFDEESWDLSLEQYPPINLLEKPFKYFLGTKGKVYPDRLSLQQIFYWFNNARLLDGKLLSPTHLSLAFNALRTPALSLPDFEQLLEVLCAQRLLREEVLRDRLVDPRVLRPPGKRPPSPESVESSEASHSPRPSLLFLDEEEEEGEFDEEGEEDGLSPLPRATALSGAERGASRTSDRQGTVTSQRGSKRASAEQGEESAPGSKHASGARGSSRGGGGGSRAGSKTNV